MQDIIFSVFPNENFVDLGLYQFGWEKCKPAHSFGPAARNHYLFHYVISGTGTIIAEGSKGITQAYLVKSSQGFMIFPDQITTYIADRDLPWEYVWIEFDGLRARSIVETAGLTMDSPIYQARSKELREEMKNEMLYITENRDSSPLHLIGHLYLFLDYLTRSSASIRLTQGRKLRDLYVQQALSFIEDNFQNDISVEEIAAACGINRSYFGKIFRDTVGKPPQEFLLNYRMGKAAELLKLTSLTIGEIGIAVGYANQMHFSRAFKNIYGVSPRAWRSQNKVLTENITLGRGRK